MIVARVYLEVKMVDIEWDVYEAVKQFARLAHHFSEGDLEKPWAWQDYDDGVRHAFFRTYEELRERAALEASKRVQQSNTPSAALRMLTQYHTGFRDLQAILIGLSDEDADTVPEEDAWSVRSVAEHIIRAERSFYAITLDALERVRSQDGRPLGMSDAAFERFIQGDQLEQLLETAAPLSQLMVYYEDMHTRVMADFVSISDLELQIPCLYWESKPMPIQFRRRQPT